MYRFSCIILQISNDTINQCTCSVPCSETWLSFLSAIEHAPFRQRNRVAGIMTKSAYFYVFITQLFSRHKRTCQGYTFLVEECADICLLNPNFATLTLNLKHDIRTTICAKLPYIAMFCSSNVFPLICEIVARKLSD